MRAFSIQLRYIGLSMIFGVINGVSFCKKIFFYIFFIFFGSVCAMDSFGSFKKVKCIILNGTSCAGKSSLSKAIAVSLRAIHISIDDYLHKIMFENYNFDHKAQTLRESGINIPHNDYSEIYATFHIPIIELIKKGNTVVIDHHFSTVPEPFYDLLYRLQEYKNTIYLCKVYCSKEEALRRLYMRNKSCDEKQHRNKEQVESHFKSLDKIHGGKVYTYEVDTTNKSPEGCAQEILMDIKKNFPSRMEQFEKNYTKKNCDEMKRLGYKME